jgi:hypothetical protein
MAAKEGFSVKVAVKGLKETRAALALLPENATEELKDTSFDLSKRIAQTIKTVAASRGSQASLMAGTVSWGTNTGNDSIFPEVQAGGTSKVGRNRKPAYKLLFGSEFGAFYLHQFPIRNPRGYWFFPTIDTMSDQIAEEWSQAADRVIEQFGEE